MHERSRDLRDEVVRGLAGLSLVVVLALMGALFIGSVAIGSPDSEDVAVADRQKHEAGQDSGLAQANPLGLLLGTAVIGGGLGVLLVGAFKPPRSDGRELAEILRR